MARGRRSCRPGPAPTCEGGGGRGDCSWRRSHQHRFKKGQSGNPAGRPRKQKPDDDLRSLIERIGSEEVEIGGQMVSLRELELRSLQRKAAKGDVAASKHLMRLRELAGCDKPKSGGGVLVVPASVPLDEWSAAAARQQAKYREKPTIEEEE